MKLRAQPLRQRPVQLTFYGDQLIGRRARTGCELVEATVPPQLRGFTRPTPSRALAEHYPIAAILGPMPLPICVVPLCPGDRSRRERPVRTLATPHRVVQR